MSMCSKIVRLLNEIGEADIESLRNLIDYRVYCNEELAQHPRILHIEMEDQAMVGLLGILNGVVEPDRRVVGIYQEINGEEGNWKLQRFEEFKVVDDGELINLELDG